MKILCRASLLLAAGLPLIAQDAGANRDWEYSFSASGYIVPDTPFFVSPTFTADHDWLHLEARYNYEDHKTGSVWAGYNFSGGDKLSWSITPMVGGVFGQTAGVAPGYQWTLDYKKLAFSSTGEYVIDTKDSSASYFYTWSELSYSPVDWLRAGIAIQRTKVYHTGLDIQRGFLVGFSRKKIDFTTYVFNAGWTDPTVIFTLGARF